MTQPSFRDVQCAEFEDWVYPEDGKLHTWTSYRMPEGKQFILFVHVNNVTVHRKSLCFVLRERRGRYCSPEAES